MNPVLKPYHQGSQICLQFHLFYYQDLINEIYDHDDVLYMMNLSLFGFSCSFVLIPSIILNSFDRCTQWLQ